MENSYSLEGFLDPAVLDMITEVRIQRPAVIESEARRRRKRNRLTRDGKMVLVALDHPARGVTRVGDRELAMADRYELLARARRVMSDPNLDGFLAASDVVEDMLILSHLERMATGRSFLDGRVVVGSMNRGGLSETIFEMDDTFTSFTARRLAQLRCDGGKMLYRLDRDDPASLKTITACAEAINSLRRFNLPAFLEPLVVEHTEGYYRTLNDVASIVRNCGIASALGESSSRMWLKLPYCKDFSRVCRATTLPILLLGGPARDDPREVLADFFQGLSSGARVRGAIIGRNLLFPSGGDPIPMCRALTSLVHTSASLDDACHTLSRPHPLEPVELVKKKRIRR
jgi:Cgl0159-like